LGWAQYLLPTTYQLQGLWQFNAMLEEQVLPVDDVSGVEPGKQNESGAWLLSGELAAEQFQALLRVDDNKTLTLPIEQLKLKLRGDGLGFQSDFNFLSQTVGSMSGEFEYAGEELKGRARLENLQLKPFQGLSSDLTHLAGQLSGDLRFVLQESRPELFGDLDLQALSVESRSLPFALNKGNMSMQFQRQKLTLKGGMNLGSGYAAFSGNADWRNSDWRIALSSQASDIIIEPLPHSYARVVSDLTVLATPERVEIGGSVSIPEARVNVEKLPQNAVTVSDDSLIEEQQNDSLKSMHVTVDVKSTLGDDVQLRAYGLETRLQGQVRIRKKAGQLMTGNGVVNLIGGRYRAYGQDLILEEGRLIFAGPLSNPDIFVTAIRNHTADNVRVGVRASGPAKAPELSLFSTPQMAEQDLLYYLLTGKGPQSASVSQSRLATQTAIALGLAQSNRRAREIGESVGIKDFQLGADVGKQGDEIQLSGYVTPDLYLQYGVSVFDQLSAVTARYTLTPSVYVEIYSSTTSAIDVFWSIVKP
jgi:translocation and assembly module TamB